MKSGDVWNGVPPVGSTPISNRWKHLFMLLAVILIEWILWALYRYISLPFIETAFSKLGFLFHIVAAPTIGLLPIVIYWKFVAKEKGLPWKFTRKNLFTSVMVGALAAAFLMVAYQFATFLVLAITGYAIPSTLELISLWRTSFANGEVDWFILMTFTFFFIVGPVEELQYRSFLQDQIGRAFKPSTGLFIASALFALSHLPIYFLVYRLGPAEAFFTLCWTFTMGSVLGVFYFQSRNIWGPIIMHGFWDWVLSVWALDLRLRESFFTSGNLQSILWLSALIPMALLTMFLINIFYSAFWKKNRPDASFGIGPFRPLSNVADSLGERLSRLKISKVLQKQDSPMLGYGKRVRRSVIVVLAIIAITMMLSAPGTVWMAGPTNNEYQRDLSSEEGKIVTSFVQNIYVREGDAQHINIPINDTWLVWSISLTVFWADEAPVGPRFTNLPDTFSAIMEITDQGPLEEGPDDSGSLVFNWKSEGKNLTNRDASVSITCVSAGDQSPIFDITGARRRADNGNEVTISAQLEYYEL